MTREYIENERPDDMLSRWFKDLFEEDVDGVLNDAVNRTTIEKVVEGLQTYWSRKGHYNKGKWDMVTLKGRHYVRYTPVFGSVHFWMYDLVLEFVKETEAMSLQIPFYHVQNTHLDFEGKRQKFIEGMWTDIVRVNNVLENWQYNIASLVESVAITQLNILEQQKGL